VIIRHLQEEKSVTQKEYVFQKEYVYQNGCSFTGRRFQIWIANLGQGIISLEYFVDSSVHEGAFQNNASNTAMVPPSHGTTQHSTCTAPAVGTGFLHPLTYFDGCETSAWFGDVSGFDSWMGVEIVHWLDNRCSVYKLYNNFDTFILKVRNSFCVRIQSTEIQIVCKFQCDSYWHDCLTNMLKRR
jgi:hypothetical protein